MVWVRDPDHVFGVLKAALLHDVFGVLKAALLPARGRRAYEKRR
jgi:hypothetical protein